MARTPRAAAQSASQPWVILRMSRLSKRSAIRPPYGGQDQHRQELQRGGDADGDAGAAGQLEHQPVLGDPLHPGADVGDEGSGDVDPVVAAPERGEHAGRGRPAGPDRLGRLERPRAVPVGGGRSGPCPVRWHRSRVWILSRITTARRSTSLSSGSSSAMRWASHSDRRCRRSSSRSRPAGVSETSAWRRSVGSGVRTTSGRSCSALTIRVIDGAATRSAAASAPMGWSSARARVPIADSWLGGQLQAVGVHLPEPTRETHHGRTQPVGEPGHAAQVARASSVPGSLRVMPRRYSLAMLNTKAKEHR